MKSVWGNIQFEIRSWRLSLLLGIVFILFSLLLMFTPLDSYAAMVIAFSIVLFVCGIVEIVFSLINRKNLFLWEGYLGAGLVDLLIGCYLICRSDIPVIILSLIVSFWFMFKGFLGIGQSVSLKKYGSKEWGWTFFMGIMVVLCSVATICFPIFTAFPIVYIISFAFLFIGLLRLVYAFQLKKMNDKRDDQLLK